MRFTTTRTLRTVQLLAAAAIFIPAAASAVPITGGRGPGGIDAPGLGTDLTLWLDADSITGVTSGTQFGTWSDQSGKGNHGTQIDPDRRPVWTDAQQNGRAVVTFDGLADGTGDFFDLGANNLFDLAGTDGMTFFSTVRLTTVSDTLYPAILSAKANISQQLQIFRTSRTEYRDISFGSTASARVRTNNPADFNLNWQNLSIGYNGAGNGTASNYSQAVDGKSETISASSTFANNPSTANSTLGVDGTIRDDQRWVGDMAEIIIFDRALNLAEHTIVDNYLSAKYDVAMLDPANDHYEGDDPGQGDYDRDVFGVGQVDSSNVHPNGGAAGFGIETTGTALTDGEWVLAGHNVETNSLFSNRWQRVWYVDATKVDGIDATLSFDFSDAGLTAPDFDPDKTGISLLYSATDPFNFMNLGLTAMFSGDTVSFDVPNLQLLDGYYTLGVVAIPEPSTGLLLGIGAVVLTTGKRRNTRRNDRSKQA